MSLRLKIRDRNIDRYKIKDDFLKEIKILIVNEGMRDQNADFTIDIYFPKDIKLVRVVNYIYID